MGVMHRKPDHCVGATRAARLSLLPLSARGMEYGFWRINYPETADGCRQHRSWRTAWQSFRVRHRKQVGSVQIQFLLPLSELQEKAQADPWKG